MNDLSLVTTEEICNELRKRFSCFVIGYETNITNSDSLFDMHWGGSLLGCLGLCEASKEYIKGIMLGGETDEL